jgi:DNA-binding transcriptional MocR family regulator
VELKPHLDSLSDVPLYKQLSAYLSRLIETGDLLPGDRLPPTRELAGQLGLNRTTVSAAYEILETSGLIKGAVGRGSFVCPPSHTTTDRSEHPDWPRLLNGSHKPAQAASRASGVIDFSASRPSEKLFPIAEFRACCEEVLASDRLRPLLQLGSPGGYEPLRSYLMKRSGAAGPSDDILITNGCQQAVDLLRRALVRPGTKVAIEEPVYPGLRNLFTESGADLIGVPVGDEGADLYALRQAFEAGAKLVVLTPSFQNPTGARIPMANRRAIVTMTKAAGAAIIENDIYSELAYSGVAVPRLKSLDADVILLGSFSKIAFPGIRCGWIIAPRPVIARVTELKQLADLHTDQLSQAFVLRFAESGRLANHQEKMVAAGREKLRAMSQAARRHLADCKFSPPEGGMNMWVELPDGLDAGALRGLARQAGVDYLPGRYFSVSRPLDSGLRLSFAGLEPDEIRKGVEILGAVIRAARELQEDAGRPALALV